MAVRYTMPFIFDLRYYSGVRNALPELQ